MTKGFKTRYEWLAELVAAVDLPVFAKGDIVEVHHFETASELLKFMRAYPAETGLKYEYGMVKDRLDDTDDLIERSWAYADEKDNLPSQFCDGSADTGKVPVRFKRELHRALWADHEYNIRKLIVRRREEVK